MSEIKLLPCPFCGGEAKFGTFNHFWIECTNCEMETPYMENEEELVALWNTRKSIDDMVKQLEKASDYYECDEQGREYVQMVDLSKSIEIVRGGRE